MSEGTRAGPLPKVRYKRARLSVLKGPDEGLALEAAGKLIKLGSSTDNDLVLSDPLVSRRHCEILLTESGFRVRDLSSTNGVLLQGTRVHDASFDRSSELTLGDTRLAITLLAEGEDREQSPSSQFQDVVGRSAKMRELFADLERVAPATLSVLLEGETGSGKDVIAESIHRASQRSDGPYVVFDCGAVAPTLVESELFGHERGAFTGATHARAGVFEEANGGTLFLDEVGELPKELQPKLLRALEAQSIKRLGGRAPVAIDVRVISATNRNLMAEVARGQFRQDLYYRLAAVKLEVPPLRERLDDIPMLVEHFLGREKAALPVTSVPAEVWEMFAAHRWPGNVRELRHAVQRLVIAPELSMRLHAQHDPAAKPKGDVLPLRVARRDAADVFEREYVVDVLQRASGNPVRAALLAEVSRQMIQKLMRKHGIEGE
ncbi:MAG TPA: sigma 54-interacting transcriptional regulator [Polyangiales bacterium]|nr:sigma 54-interacting transcriptional regulator [Polyangiales bacterium]